MAEPTGWFGLIVGTFVFPLPYLPIDEDNLVLIFGVVRMFFNELSVIG